MKDTPFPDRLIIDGQRENGTRFRPSDWVERISASLATFGPDNRLRYSSLVQPCIIQGQKCLVVARKLNQTHPELYAFILDFARQNELRIQEDRRQTNRPVAKERRARQWPQDEAITPAQASSYAARL